MSDKPSKTERQLAEVENVFRTFMYMPHEHAYTVSTLWVAHSHLRGHDGHFLPQRTPRLYFGSKAAGCGKTMAMELVTLMSHNGEIHTNPTQFGLTTAINNNLGTIGLDEIDKYFGTRGSSKQDVQIILNNGYKQGAYVTCQRNDEVEYKFVHGPLTMAGKNLNRFMTSDVFETLRTRSIIIPLERKPIGHKVAEYDSVEHESYLRHIGARLQRWGAKYGREITSTKVAHLIPKGIDNRDKEIWTVLFQIAAFAGGEWPKRVESAAKALVLGQDDSKDTRLSPSEELLVAAKDAFRDEETFLPTKTLLARLMANEGAWWTKQWHNPMAAAKGLAANLDIHGVDKVRHLIDGEQCRGYELADLIEAVEDLSEDDEPTIPDEPTQWDWDMLDDE